MKTKLFLSIIVMFIFSIVLVNKPMTISAATPIIEEVELKKNGKVEIDFHGKVVFKKFKIKIKDNKNKSYKAIKIRKDDDDVKFVIKNIKPNKTYKISLKGLKQRGTSKYGTVKTKIKTPKANKNKNISANTAIKLAKNHAITKYNVSKIYDIDAESDFYLGQSVWEVNFDGICNGHEYEFEYKISKKNGTILLKERELD